MADDSRRISGSVSIEPTTKEYVAWEIAKRIAHNETEMKFDRQYWLTLYHQCHKAVSGHSLASVLKKGDSEN